MPDFELKIDKANVGKPIPQDLKAKLSVVMAEMERLNPVGDNLALAQDEALWYVAYRTDAAVSTPGEQV